MQKQTKKVGGRATKARAKRSPRRSADSVDKVYEAVKTLSIDYRFKPGERVNEVELAGRLGVSRTPIREALNRLVRDGFMRFVPNKGFFAREIAPDTVRDLYELRVALEVAAFKLACVRANNDAIEAAVAIWENSSKDDAEAGWVKLAETDERFHIAIARLAGNPQIVETLESVNAHIRFFRRIDLGSLRHRTRTYDEHAAIIDSLRRRDAAAGAATLETHVTLSSEHAVEVTKEGLARIFLRNPAP